MKNLFFERFLDPFLIVLVSIIAYAPQIPWLGFVIDDWAYIDFYSFRGLDGLVSYTFLIDSRPFAFWIPWIGFKLFGTAPLPWQVWTLFWCILAALMFWLVLKNLFPGSRWQNLLAALLFSVYPLYFTHIDSALQLSVHAVSYFLILLSMFLTVCALRHPRYWFGFTAAAVLTSFAQILTIEYFAGLELGRALLIFYLTVPRQAGWWRRLAQSFKQWLPYLLIWVFWAVWRVALMPRPPADRNAPTALLGLLDHPLSTLLTLAQTAIQDTIQMLGGIWARTYEYAVFSFSPPIHLVAWGIALLGVGLIILALRRIPAWKEESPFPWQVALAGFILLILGFLPTWAVGKQMAYFTINADRFGMASIPGAVLLIVAAAGLLFKNRVVQAGMLILLIGLGMAFQIRSLASNRYSWEQQQDFFWQLKWRAPAIEPGTALVGNGQLIDSLGDWFLTPALDHLYSAGRPSLNPVVYYFDALDLANPILSADGQTIWTDRYKRVFKSQAAESLVLQYDYGSKSCLWIVTEADRNNPYLEEGLKTYLPLSNLKRIQDGSDVPYDPQAFGSSHPLDWCYFFQKGKLAEQNQDWAKMMDLWGQANQKGFTPHNPTEIIPFIKAAAFLGEWDAALVFSQDAYNPKERMHDYLCQAWAEIGQQTAGKPGQPAAVETAHYNFNCP